jgi:hypothetical protein
VPAAEGGTRFTVKGGQPLTEDEHLARIWISKPGEQVQERRLAGPRRPRDRGEPPGCEGGIEFGEDEAFLRPAPVGLGEPSRLRDDPAVGGGRTDNFGRSRRSSLDAGRACRTNDDPAPLQLRAGALSDPGADEQLLGQAHPTPTPDDERFLSSALVCGFLADTPVTNANGPVGDRSGLDVVADDDGRTPLLTSELADQLVDEGRADGVELAGRLVGEQEHGAVRERGAHRDPLLLATRELARASRALVAEADPLEKLVRASIASASVRSGEAELERDELPGGQIGVERTRVVLLDVSEHARSVIGEPAPTQLADVVPEDRHPARRGAVEPRQDPQEGGLARAARPEDDEHLTLFDRERESLESRRVAFGRRVDAEDVTSLDGAHRATLLVVPHTSRAATAA